MKVVEEEKKRKKKKGIDFDISNSAYKLNENIKFKTGTIDDKNFPKTIYLLISFWFDLDKAKILEDFETDISFNRFFKRKINRIYHDEISLLIKENKLFPFYDTNIYSFDVPHNVIYSNKKCFCSIELTLHTSNIIIEDKSFQDNLDCELFKNIITISKKISSSDFFKKNKYYNVFRKK
jgi:hypothetical protein